MCIKFKENIQDILVKEKTNMLKNCINMYPSMFQNMSVDISVTLCKIAYHIALV